MNTPTPITDAAWAQTFDANGFLSGRGNAASQMRDACATLERELAALTAERDQLRAALADPQQLHAHCLRTLNEGQIAHLFGGRMTEIVNRAERAEAELAVAKERLRSEAMDDYASIKHLQRELATERARLDAGTILLTVAGERVWHCGVDLRAAIDAGIKEGEK
jgi:hypothetical protein